MARKANKCYLCGHKIKHPDGYLTKYKGKTVHVGCATQKAHSDKYMKELFERK